MYLMRMLRAHMMDREKKQFQICNYFSFRYRADMMPESPAFGHFKKLQKVFKVMRGGGNSALCSVAHQGAMFM
jgi:hypothetical protein